MRPSTLHPESPSEKFAIRLVPSGGCVLLETPPAVFCADPRQSEQLLHLHQGGVRRHIDGRHQGAQPANWLSP